MVKARVRLSSSAGCYRGFRAREAESRKPRARTWSLAWAGFAHYADGMTSSWILRLGILSGVALSIGAGAPPAQRSTAARATTLAVLVTSRTGEPLADASVKVEGAVSRDGTTDDKGSVTFQSMSAGTYRAHVEHDGYVALEKEVTLKTGVRTSAEASLTAAPPPPPPPAPEPVAPPAPVLTPGEAKTVDVTNLAERELDEKDPVVDRTIGCSGATSARLIRLLDLLPAASHDDADEMVYVVAGDATITLGHRDQSIGPGSFSIVPRGTEFSVKRRGRNPVILLSIVSGQPCGGA